MKGNESLRLRGLTVQLMVLMSPPLLDEDYKSLVRSGIDGHRVVSLSRSPWLFKLSRCLSFGRAKFRQPINVANSTTSLLQYLELR